MWQQKRGAAKTNGYQSVWRPRTEAKSVAYDETGTPSASSTSKPTKIKVESDCDRKISSEQKQSEDQSDEKHQGQVQKHQGQVQMSQDQSDEKHQSQVTFDMSSPLTIEEVRTAAGQGDERATKALADLGRLSEAKQPLASVAMMHRLATVRGRGQYVDPNTGFMVFTATYLKQRNCCNLGCRHCPHLSSRNAQVDKCKGEKGSQESASSLGNNW